MPLRADVQSNIEVTDVWVDPGTRDVTMVAWNAGTSSLYFGFASPDGDSALFVNPVEEDKSGLAPANPTAYCASMTPPPNAPFVPRKPLSVACSRAGSGECWVTGEKGMLLFHGPRNPTMNYKECSYFVANASNPAYRAIYLLTDPANFEKYEYFGVGDGGSFFLGGRDPILPSGSPVFGPYIRPVMPQVAMRPPGALNVTTIAKTGVALVGGAGGYVGRIANAGMGYTATQIPVNTTDDISDMAVVRDHLLIVTKGGQLLDVPVP